MTYIAFLGIDGCGKSTVLKYLKDDSFYSNYVFLWVRWKPSLLKPFYKLINKGNYEKSLSQDELNNEYNKKSNLKKKIFKSKIIRSVWMKLAYVDYRRSFKKKIKCIKNSNIIFDRYYYDLFIDQGINFGYTPEQIYEYILKYKKKFLNLNNTIYIRVLPETSFSRKKDIPNLEYLYKRFEVYEFLAEKMNWTVIDGSIELKDEIELVKKNIEGKGKI